MNSGIHRQHLLKNQKDATKRVELLKASWAYQYKHFFENSTLHGVRYINEKDRPFIERFMWFCFTTIGALVTLIIIVSLWDKFQTNPTITGLDTDFHNWNVVFPAILFCPVDAYNEEAILKKVEEWSAKGIGNANRNITYLKFLKTLSSIKLENFQKLEEFEKENFLEEKEDILKLIEEIVVKLPTFISNCKFLNEEINCEEEFHGILTEVGYCFGFNSAFSFKSNKKYKQFNPKMILETDENWLLSYDMHTTNYSVLIYAQTPYDFPVFDIRPQYEYSFASVKAIYFGSRETYTTEEAHQLSIAQRKCVFNDEVKLEISDIYTYSGCLSNCRLLKAIELCSCVPIFYTKIGNYEYCNSERQTCIMNNYAKIISAVCDCELGCMNTVYEVEKFKEADSEYIFEKYSMDLGFTSWPIVRYKREVLFGWVDLLVSFGGIAGLFLGFSLLSGVEIIYFFTIRAFCMTVREKDTLYNEIKQEKSKIRPPLSLSLKPFKNLNESTQRRLPSSNINRIVPIQGPTPTPIKKNIKTKPSKYSPYHLEYLP